MREDDVRAMLVVAQAGSINKAAELLYVSPQGLRRTVRGVEAALGYAVFERHPRGVRVTPQGEAALALMRELVAIYGALRQIGQPLPVAAAGRAFALYVSPQVREPLVSLALPKLMGLFPGVEFSVCGGSPQAFAEEPLWGLYLLMCVDGGVVAELDEAAVFVQQLYEDEAQLVVSRSHPLARYAHVSLAEALAHPFALLEEGAAHPFALWCGARGLPLSVRLRTAHLPTLLAAVRSGRLVGLWPVGLPADRQVGGEAVLGEWGLQLVRLSEPLYFPVCAVALRACYEAEGDIIEGFLQLVRRELG